MDLTPTAARLLAAYEAYAAEHAAAIAADEAQNGFDFVRAFAPTFRDPTIEEHAGYYIKEHGSGVAALNAAAAMHHGLVSNGGANHLTDQIIALLRTAVR